MTGKGLWAELEFMEEAECKEMLKGEHILFVSFLTLCIFSSRCKCLKTDVSCQIGEEYSGAAGEWTEHRQFLPSIEFCAAKVSSFSFICQIHMIFGSFFSFPDSMLCAS